MTPSRPDWAPFAELMLYRLRALAQHRRDSDDDTPDDLDLPGDRPPLPPFDPLDQLRKAAGRHRRPPEEIEAVRAAGLAPFAMDESGATRPARPLPAREILLALRLAATFGSEAAMTADLLAPGALTMLTGMTPLEAEVLSRLVGKALLPDGWTVLHKPRTLPQKGLVVLLPYASDGQISRHARDSFLREVVAGLDAAQPVLALLPDGCPLPDALGKAIPAPRVLAPLSRELLLAHLRASHSATGQVDEDVVLPLLPGDAGLAALPREALLVALRSPTARGVAERLACAAAPVPGTPRLEEMRGDAPALRAARRLVADLALWREGGLGWSEMTRSLLLHGAPGTGKSWLARATGASAGAAFIQASFAEWQAAGHLGNLLAAMRATFAEAKRLKPAILFIDEIDAAGSRFGGDAQLLSYRTQVINGFLQEIDALMQDEGVLLIGACNTPERLDPAILRPGRFDLHLEVPRPDRDAIRGILARAFDAPTGTLHPLARRLAGRTAAEIDALIRGARSAAREARRGFGPEELLGQLSDELGARARIDRRIALHECGHAIVATALGFGRIERLQITPRGGETLRHATLTEGLAADIRAELAVHMAGRAAERLVLGDISAGAGGSPASDLAQATTLAASLDSCLGLGAHGPVWRGASATSLDDGADISRVRARLDQAERQAGEILNVNRALLEEMAEALVGERELVGDKLGYWIEQVIRVSGIVQTHSEVLSKNSVRSTS